MQYMFEQECPIEKCTDCPCLQYVGILDIECGITGYNIKPDYDIGIRNADCPLIKVEENYGSPVMG